MPTSTHQRRTPTIRIGLRSWLVAFTALTLLVGYWVSRANTQRRVAATLTSTGAEITYRYQYDNYEDVDNYSLNLEREPPILAKYIGIDFCSPIVRVSSVNASDPGSIAKLTSQLPRLRLLAIQDTDLQDIHLEELHGHTHLLGLYLRGTSITDRSVSKLASLKTLHVLNLQDTRISAHAIQRLRAELPDTRVHH